MTIIRTLDDVTLIPTPVTYLEWSNGAHVKVIRERLQAELFPELKGKPVTVVLANAYGEPYVMTGRFGYAIIQPSSHMSPWEISMALREKGKRGDISFRRDFPTGPFILLRGEHAIDVRDMALPPAIGCLSQSHIYVDVWALVSIYCDTIGGDDVLIDTAKAAEDWYRENYPQRFTPEAIEAVEKRNRMIEEAIAKYHAENAAKAVR